jgi:hypothetical protein
MAGCGPRDRSHETGAAVGGGPGTETGSMSDSTGAVAQPDMTRDTTGMGGMPADTVNQPVTPKGDSIKPGADSHK